MLLYIQFPEKDPFCDRTFNLIMACTNDKAGVLALELQRQFEKVVEICDWLRTSSKFLGGLSPAGVLSLDQQPDAFELVLEALRAEFVQA